jgi:L-Ala-D/L-Glu epimerase
MHCKKSAAAIVPSIDLLAKETLAGATTLRRSFRSGVRLAQFSRRVRCYGDTGFQMRVAGVVMQLEVRREGWPLTRPFVISRVTATRSIGLHVRLTRDGKTGQGESEPHESDLAVAHEAEQLVSAAAGRLSLDADLDALNELIPLASARNAVDCALWDLRAKMSGVPAWKLLGLEQPRPLTTAMTIGIDTPAAMERSAQELRNWPLIKIKLGRREQDIARVEAVRRAAPDAQLIVDANEGWTFDQLADHAPHLARLSVRLIEQPLPADADDALIDYTSPVPLCADEACRDRSSLARIKNRYQMVNIKLDKTGGLTEALLLARQAMRLGLRVMTGCNVGTSLAMAPAALIGQLSEYVDLDAPLMLVADRQPAMLYDLERGELHPPSSDLWG